MVAVLTRWLYYQCGCITKMAVFSMWLYYHGGCINKVAVLPMWLHYQGGCITRIAILWRCNASFKCVLKASTLSWHRFMSSFTNLCFIGLDCHSWTQLFDLKSAGHSVWPQWPTECTRNDQWVSFHAIFHRCYSPSVAVLIESVHPAVDHVCRSPSQLTGAAKYWVMGRG